MAGDIIKGSDHFFINKYVGNGGGQKTGRFVPFTDNATIAKSCMFDDDTNNFLSRTPSSNGSGTTLTLSVWVKRNILGYRDILYNGNIVSNSEHVYFDSSDRLHYYEVTSGSRKWNIITNMTFEDTSKWYHIHVVRDTTDSTAGDRIRFYVDGTRITSFNTATYPTLNQTGYWNQTTYQHSVGSSGSASYIRGIGYLAEMNMIDGTVYEPSTFGMTDTSTGRWIPKSFSSLSYGTNGFRFEFANSAGQTIGDDTSGNGNDFSVTNLDPHNIGNDTPTSNYAKMSVNYHAGATNNVREGGRRMQPASGSDDGTFFDIKLKTGKWYVEFYAHSADAVAQYIYNGISDFEKYVTDGVQELGRRTHSYAFDPANGRYFAEGSGVVTGLSPKITQGDIGGIAVDFDNNKIFFSINGTYINSANPANGTGGLAFAPAHDTLSGYYMLGQSNGTGSSGYNNDVSWNVGDNPTFNGTLAVGAAANTDGFGSTFKYTPPDGFKGLSFDNQPDEGVKPDLVWIKNRDATDSHQWYDSSRGPLLDLQTDSTNTESTTVDGLQRFIKGGCQIEDDVSINTKGEKYVAWNWVANGGTETANADGSGASLASTHQVNETAGFSIVKYSGSGTGSSVAGTVAHGLSQTPNMIIIKSRTAGNNWIVYHHKISDPSDKILYLNDTNAETDWPYMGDTDPTNKVFTISSDLETGRASNDYMAYCWYEVPGYSRFGTYKGNANADGPFIYLGFKPRFMMIKEALNSNYWAVFDTERKDFNPNTLRLAPNYNYAEDDHASYNPMDFLSNGIKMRGTDTTTNRSGGTYVYAAWAEHPFNGNGENAFATAK